MIPRRTNHEDTDNREQINKVNNLLIRKYELGTFHGFVCTKNLNIKITRHTFFDHVKGSPPVSD